MATRILYLAGIGIMALPNFKPIFSPNWDNAICVFVAAYFAYQLAKHVEREG